MNRGQKVVLMNAFSYIYRLHLELCADVIVSAAAPTNCRRRRGAAGARSH